MSEPLGNADHQPDSPATFLKPLPGPRRIVHQDRMRNILGYLLATSGQKLVLEAATIDGLPEYEVEQRLLDFGAVEFSGIRSLGS